MKIIFLKMAFLMLVASCTVATSAQSLIYGPISEMLQSSTQSKFLSSNGTYYIQNNDGNTNFNYWWNAHGIEGLLDGYQRTRSSVYTQRMKTLLNGIRSNNGGTYPTYFYDDMAWLALASLRAYENTSDADYLTAANTLWADMKGGQHPEQGGALQWNKGAPNSFNSCTNAPAILLAIRMARVNNNSEDQATAISIYNWMKTKLVDNTTGAVWDSYDAGTLVTNKDWVFSYNVGTWIGAGLELYKKTGTQSYLDDAVLSANYALNNRLYNGVLWANEDGGGDGGLFKGVFYRYLALLAKEGSISQTNRDRYNEALKTTARGVYDVATNKTSQLVNNNLLVPAGTTIDYSSQLSGIMLMEIAANLDKITFYKDINYGGYASSLPVGNYTKKAMVAAGIADNDITSLTIPTGIQVTLYENDNFTGASVVKTASASWIGSEWNDRASSFIIATTSSPVLYTGDGLKASFYNGMNFDTLVYTQKSANVNFDWGTGSPATCINTNKYSVRWTGEIMPKYSETYTFYLIADDGCRMWINNQQIINKWSDDGGTEYSGTIALKAGQKYDIKVEYYENTASAKCKLEWSSISQTREVVPQSKLFSSSSTGDGLIGNYYNGLNFNTIVGSKKDANINFNWGSTAPVAGINSNVYSIRWSGLIKPLYSETYTYYVTSDDGCRLYVNDQLVVSKWIDDGGTTYSGSISLVAGQKYNIKLEYFENTGDAKCILEWASTSQSRQVIPQSQLYSSELSGDGLSATYYNGMSFNTSVLSRTDATVNFIWGTAAPATGVNADGFSVRWTGNVKPKTTETYVFYVTSDDGCRLYVNNQLLVDKWINDGGTLHSGAIALNAGQPYTINLEYFENTSGASCKLEWASSSQAREVIPQSQLFTVSTLIPGNIYYQVLENPEITNLFSADGAVKISVYPNPVSQILFISGLNNPLEMNIFNTIGQKVMHEFGTTINVGDLKSGIYFIKFKQNNENFMFKFIKK